MARHPTFSLVLPCYNEGAILTDNAHRIHTVLSRLGYPFEMIFVDDASLDRTQARIARVCKKYSHCRALYHIKNTGRGGAVTDGIRIARGSVVGFIDIDCEVSPVYIPEIVDMIIRRRADVVIGKRMYRSTVSSLMREVLSTGYRWIVSGILKTRGLDTESGYKFFRKSKILPVLTHIHDRGWFWDTEIMVYAIRAGLHVTETPVLFLRRSDKKSSVRMVRDTLNYLVKLAELRIYLLKKVRK